MKNYTFTETNLDQKMIQENLLISTKSLADIKRLREELEKTCKEVDLPLFIRWDEAALE